MNLIFRQHAIQRMFQRSITLDEIKRALDQGGVIENYPNDTPYPSRLWLGYAGARPLHIVYAENTAADEYIVITVYQPDPTQWAPGFTQRRNAT